MGFIDILLSKLAPHVCLGCGQEGSLLCRACDPGLPAPLSRAQTDCLDAVHAAAAYEDIARDLVRQLKFRGAQAAAGIMARHMLPLIPVDDSGAIIVPVPTANRRVRQRGFDQAKLLARLLSRRTGLRYMDCLSRHGHTHQVGANREQRLQQLRGAFQLKHGIPPDSHIILVDDVMTTGATLEAAATVLRAAAIRRMDAVVFALAD